MAAIYILYSKKVNRHYIGSCLDVTERIEQHLNKVFPKAFTKRADDWVIKFSMDNLNAKQAKQIENHIKKMKSVTYINNLLKHPEMTQKLIENYRAGSSR
jgi:putative endonuclease